MYKIDCAMDSSHGPGKSQDRLTFLHRILSDGQYQTEGSDRALYAIMDGVGGIPGGEVASSFCACEVINCPLESILADEGSQAVEKMESLIENIDTSLKNAGAMATTLSGLLIVNSQNGLLFHVGNTRVWGLAGCYLRQLTTDHTQLVDMEMQGVEITDAMRANIGHIITASLGGSDNTLRKKLVVEWVSLDPYEAFLFTCDGVHEHVDIAELENIVSCKKPLREAIDLARKNGSKDDCSIMVVRKEEKAQENTVISEPTEEMSESRPEEKKAGAQEEASDSETNGLDSILQGQQTGKRFSLFGRK